MTLQTRIQVIILFFLEQQIYSTPISI